MSDTDRTPDSHPAAEAEREIRDKRRFTVEEAVGRLAGPGAMKGGSAVSRTQEAQNAVRAWLSANVPDPAGALNVVLHRNLRDSELLNAHLDDPPAAAATYLRLALGSDHRLREIVRQADAEWGQAMDERPYFDVEGRVPHADDPYTTETVRAALTAALHGS